MRGVLVVAIAAAMAGSATAEDAGVYRGACDASAVALLGDRHFVVASDEDNHLRIYRLDAPEPVGRVDLYAHLGIDPADQHGEVDIEGAAPLGGHVFWIGSHGRSRKGRPRPHRHRLFATRFEPSEAGWRGEPVGRPYAELARDLSRHPGLVGLGLARAIRLDRSDGVEELAPRRKGLSIEGLVAGPDRSLLIGLRNPVTSDGRAILVKLENPEGLVLRGEPPRYGEPLPLELDGLGIRGMERLAPGYALLAGPRGGGGTALYRWSGAAGERPERLRSLPGLNAEGLAAAAEADRLLVVSDDGSRRVGARACKQQGDASRRAFRARWIHPTRAPLF